MDESSIIRNLFRKSNKTKKIGEETEGYVVPEQVRKEIPVSDKNPAELTIDEEKIFKQARPVLPAMPISSATSQRTIHYDVFCQSVQGQRHIDEGSDKEDNCRTYRDDEKEISVFAVADGHGDPNCARSKIGSDYASEVAVNKFLEFESVIREEGLIGQLMDPDRCEPLIRRLIISIKATWDDMVLQQLAEEPLSEAERAACADCISLYDKGQRLEYIYGTTLIAGIATQEYLLLIHQGDGRCDVFHADGTVDQPIPWDERCIGNIATSMCDSNAWEKCRYCIIDLKKDPVIACIAGSDGVEDSLPSMDALHSYYRDMVLSAVQNGIHQLEDDLAEKLGDLNVKGSCDDTTVVGIIDIEAAKAFVPLFRKLHGAEEALAKWDVANDRLTSMRPKLDYLSKCANDAMEKVRLLDGIRANAETYAYIDHFCTAVPPGITVHIPMDEYRAVSRVLKSWLNNNSSLRGKMEELQKAEATFNKASAEYEEYRSKFDVMLEKKANAFNEFNTIFTYSV